MAANARNILKCVTLLAIVAASAGCIRAPYVPPQGFLFSNTGFPIKIDFEESKIAPSEGRATSTSILGLVSWGDCSIGTAAQNGNLAQVTHVDAQYTNIVWGIYQKFEITAIGYKEGQVPAGE